MSNYDISAAENEPVIPQKPFRVTLAILGEQTITTSFELNAPDREAAHDSAMSTHMSALVWRNRDREIVPGPGLHDSYVMKLSVIDLTELVITDFSKLPLGTRFRYINGKTIWVKLDNGPNQEIAEWNTGPIPLNWIGQMICSFSADCESQSKVIIVE